MKLLSCHIDNFGKLSDLSIDFTDGVNLFHEPNAWGKSTLAAFLRVMFYGFDSKKESGSFDKERVVYRPHLAENWTLSTRIRRIASAVHSARPRRRMRIICMICRRIWSVTISLRRSEARSSDSIVHRSSEALLLRRMTAKAVRPMQSMQSLAIWQRIQMILTILTAPRSGFTTA